MLGTLIFTFATGFYPINNILHIFMEFNTMQPASQNPLAQHFRQPAIHLQLPSGGKFWPDSALDLPVTGAIPVYPMTVKDELTLKTPDALMNGSGMMDVVKSCCPSIHDPWSMPTLDIDPVFIAIRIASYGHGMDITATCPHCTAKNEYKIDLRVVTDNIKRANFDKPISLDGLIFRFKPQQYRDLNQTNMITFAEQRLIDTIVLNESLTQEEKTQQFSESFEKLRQLNIKLVVTSISTITTEDGTVVSDPAQITEFLDSCSRQLYADIKQSVDELVDANKIEPFKVTCENEQCLKEYTTSLTFDQSNFFG
jgi:hypothetical protein